MTGYDGGLDMARVLYGENARHVPGFLYVQDAGQGVVSFVGASATPDLADNPLRYGAPHWATPAPAPDDYWPHHLIVGELIVRPHVVIATRALRGFGLAQMLTDSPDLPELIEDGRLVVGTSALLADLVERTRRAPWPPAGGRGR